MNKFRPISKRKQLQLLIALTILAWATQTLFHQWGFGQVDEGNSPADLSDSTSLTAPATPPLDATPDMIASEKFVPGDGSSMPMGTLELRPDATVTGADVKVRQLCRWSDGDAAIFKPVADLIVCHIGERTSFKSVSIDDVRQTLHDAGVNLALINFIGASTCTVTRSDAIIDPQDALQAWIDSHSKAPQGAHVTPTAAMTPSGAGSESLPITSTGPGAVPAADVQQPVSNPVDAGTDGGFHTLRDLLTEDLAGRLNLAPEAMQMSFDPAEEKLLNLAEPLFQFNIRPMRARNLGIVSWEVTIISGSDSKRVTIDGSARAWQTQIVVARPLAGKQILQKGDFTVRRVLLDEMPDEVLLKLEQCVGEQADRDLKPGTVMTARMVDPVLLVKAGDLVTITLRQGSVQIRSVARAMEGGSLGQTIKVRNETTRDMLDVVITGQQEGRLAGSLGLPDLTSAGG